jgi:predicted outer membrane repeat protein
MKKIFYFLVMLLISLSAHAQTSVGLNDPANFTFVTLKIWGAGGNGSAGTYSLSNGGGGGGGGSLELLTCLGGSRAQTFSDNKHYILVDDVNVLWVGNGENGSPTVGGNGGIAYRDARLGIYVAGGNGLIGSVPSRGIAQLPSPFNIGYGGMGQESVSYGVVNQALAGNAGALECYVVETHNALANAGTVRFGNADKCILGGELYATGFTAKNGIDYQWQSSATSDFSADIIDLPNQRNPFRAVVPTNHNVLHTHFRLRAICNGIMTTSNIIDYYPNTAPLTIAKQNNATCGSTALALSVSAVRNGNMIWESASNAAMTANLTTLTNDSTISVNANNAPVYYRYTATCGTSAVYSNILAIQQHTVANESFTIDANLRPAGCGSASTLYGSGQIQQYWESAADYNFNTITALGDNTTGSIDFTPTATLTYYRAKRYCGDKVVYSNVLALCTQAVAKRIYVNVANANNGDGNSWATAFNTINDALRNAPPFGGGEIWIAQGIYKPTSSTGFTINRNVKIYGGFAGTEASLSDRNARLNVTTFSGDIGIADDDTDNGQLLSFTTSIYENCLSERAKIDSTTVIDGITFTKGRALTSSFGVTPDGGVCLIAEGFYPFFKNCIFTDNQATGNGGAIAFYFHTLEEHLKKPNFSSCVFINNKARNGGAFYANSTYVYELAGGGGPIDARPNLPHTDPKTANSNGNTAQGKNPTNTIYTATTANDFVNCIFSDNQATEKGGVFYTNGGRYHTTLTIYDETGSANGTSSSTNYHTFAPRFMNCTVLNNTAADGEMIYATSECKSGSATAYNASIVDCNNANERMFATFTNCILWKKEGESAANLFKSFQAAANVFNNTTVQGDAANGANPLFQDLTDLDGSDNKWFTEDDGLMPSCLSPALNAGNNTDAPSADVLGNPIYGSLKRSVARVASMKHPSAHRRTPVKTWSLIM